jgi:hypothetical protein
VLLLDVISLQVAERRNLMKVTLFTSFDTSNIYARAQLTYSFAISRHSCYCSTSKKKLGSYFSEVATESAHRFSLSEIEDATDKFERKIGFGGFGNRTVGNQ